MRRQKFSIDCSLRLVFHKLNFLYNVQMGHLIKNSTSLKSNISVFAVFIVNTKHSIKLLFSFFIKASLNVVNIFFK